MFLHYRHIYLFYVFECFCIFSTAELRNGGQQGQIYANADVALASVLFSSTQPSLLPHRVESSAQHHDYVQRAGNLSSMTEYHAGNQVPSVSRQLKDRPHTSSCVKIPAAPQYSGNPYSNTNPPGHDKTSEYEFFFDADQHGQNYVDADLGPATSQSSTGRHSTLPSQPAPEHHLQSIEGFAGNNQFPPDSTRTSSFQRHDGSEKVQDSATSSLPMQVTSRNCEPPFGQQEQSRPMTQEVQHLKLEELNSSASATKPFEVSLREPNGQESSDIALPHHPNQGSQNILPSRQQGSLTAGISSGEQIPRPQENVPVERHISTDFSDAGSHCPQQKIPVEMSYANVKRYFQPGAKILGRGGFGAVYEGKLMENL